MAAVTLLPSILNGSIHTSDERRDLPRPYKCPLCDKAFHRLEHQTRHIRTHTGEKPHACQFSGCTKRFSRSDELTRHSRIHNNPNSRRSSKLPSTRSYTGLVLTSDSAPVTTMMPPPTKVFSKSAPVSVVASPVVSPSAAPSSSYHLSFSAPKQHLSMHQNIPGTPLKPSNHDLKQLSSGVITTQTDRDNSLGLPRIPQPQCISALSSSISKASSNVNLMTSQPSRSHLPSVSYLLGSRSHALDDDQYSHRPVKRSRPNSPNSTAPPSPTFSNDSLSPTPDHTPLVTPAHSPRLRPFVPTGSLNCYDLPLLRNLSLHPHNTPTLAPMEPQYLDGSYYHNMNAKSHPYSMTSRLPGTSSLTEIVSRPDSIRRKLPTLQENRLSIQELVSPSDCYP